MNKKLIEVLVGDKYRTQYLTNPQFKLQVDMLASYLPYIIDGLAYKAESIQKDLNEQLRETKKAMGWGSF